MNAISRVKILQVMVAVMLVVISISCGLTDSVAPVLTATVPPSDVPSVTQFVPSTVLPTAIQEIPHNEN